MIPVDIGHVYPKTGLDVDLRFDTTPRFVSTGSLLLPGGNSDDVEVNGLSWTSDGPWSFSCWVKSNDLTSAANKKFFSVYDSVNSHRIDFQASSDADLQIYTDVSSSQPTHTFTGAATPIQDGTWHHVALVAATSSSNSVYRIFIDGQQFGADSSACARPDISSADSGYIGNMYTGSGAALTGSLAHVGFWNDVLSEAQVRSLMTATTYAEAVTKGGSTPAAYYLFETNADASVGSVDGTLGGSAVIVGDRARLPNGYDLSMTDGVPNRMSGRCFSGRAVILDGTGDYINLDGFNFDSTGAWTIESWMKLETPSAERFWFAIGDADELTCNYSTGVAGNIGFYPDGVEDAYGSALPFCDGGTWHHWCLSVGAGSSATAVLYIDGKQYATSTVTCTDISSEPKFRFAADKDGNSSLDGSIAGIKVVVGTAYSAAQALEAYQIPEQPVPGGVTSSHLKCWLPCQDYDISATDGLGGLFLQDASGNGNNGLMVNGTAEFAQSTIPQLGLQSSSSLVCFDGSDDYLVSADTGQSTNTWTISGWFCVFSNPGSFKALLGARDTGNDYGEGILVDMGSSSTSAVDYMKFDIVDGSPPADFWGGSIPFGEWFHLAITGTASTVTFYVNGSTTNCTAVTRTGSTAPKFNFIYFGTRFYGGSTGGKMHGLIQDTAFWNATLDADSVAAIYGAGRGADIRDDIGNYDQSSALQHFWRLDNPVTCKDLEGDKDLTANGSPNMATIPEGNTSGLSAFGTMTNLRPPNGISGVPGVYQTPGRNCAEMPEPAWGTDPFTVACWCYSPQPPVNGTSIWGSGDGDPYVYVKFGGSTSVSFVAYTSGGTGLTMVSTASSSEITNRWFFVCARKHSNTSWEFDVMPLDGTPANNTQTTEISTTLTSDGAAGFVVGGWDASDATPFKRGAACDIMDFRIWQGEALTDAQVNALYQSGARKARGLTR